MRTYEHIRTRTLNGARRGAFMVESKRIYRAVRREAAGPFNAAFMIMLSIARNVPPFIRVSPFPADSRFTAYLRARERLSLPVLARSDSSALIGHVADNRRNGGSPVVLKVRNCVNRSINCLRTREKDDIGVLLRKLRLLIRC